MQQFHVIETMRNNKFICTQRENSLLDEWKKNEIVVTVTCENFAILPWRIRFIFIECIARAMKDFVVENNFFLHEQTTLDAE